MSTFAVFALVLGLVLCSFHLSAGQIVSGMYVFGDSTVDSGNNNYLETLVKANFPPYGRDFDSKKPTGRFCNGRTPTDYLASFLSLPFPPAYLDPSAKGNKIVQGVNFATSASGFFERTATTFNVPGLLAQIEWFKNHKQQLIKQVGESNASTIISKALFALSTGSNDYINNYYINPILQAEYDKATYRGILVEAFANFVKEIYNIGARKISVVGLAPLGCVPSQITLYGEGKIECIDFANKDALLFNAALNSSVQSLSKSLSGIKLVYVDIYSLFMDVLKNPSQNGFQKTLTGCCGVGRLAVSILCNQFTIGTCKDATKYVFWDSFHPTDAMNKLIANTALVQGVPVLV